MLAYSKITKERLEEYYKDNFIDKDNLKKTSKEKVLSCVYWCMIVFLYFLFVLVNTKVFLPIFLEFFKLDIADGFVFFQIVIYIFVAFISCMLLSIETLIYGKIMFKIYGKLFSVQHRIALERCIKKKIADDYIKIIELQELLKTKNIEKISTDGCSAITIEYRDTNKIFKTKTIDISGNYKKTVKEECIDFRWVDEAINEELMKHNYREIV